MTKPELKPWEEHWTVALDTAAGLIQMEDSREWAGVPTAIAQAFDSARAQLAAAAPELVRVLLAVEREYTDDGHRFHCVSCRRNSGDPGRAYEHAPDCALANVLVRAGVRKGAE